MRACRQEMAPQSGRPAMDGATDSSLQLLCEISDSATSIDVVLILACSNQNSIRYPEPLDPLHITHIHPPPAAALSTLPLKAFPK